MKELNGQGKDERTQDTGVKDGAGAIRAQRTVVCRPGGCHALRPAHRKGPAGASAEDWLKAVR